MVVIPSFITSIWQRRRTVRSPISVVQQSNLLRHFIELISDLEQTWRNHPINVEGEPCFPLIHVAQIEGGEAINIIPALCTLQNRYTSHAYLKTQLLIDNR